MSDLPTPSGPAGGGHAGETGASVPAAAPHDQLAERVEPEGGVAGTGRPSGDPLLPSAPDGRPDGMVSAEAPTPARFAGAETEDVRRTEEAGDPDRSSEPVDRVADHVEPQRRSTGGVPGISSGSRLLASGSPEPVDRVAKRAEGEGGVAGAGRRGGHSLLASVPGGGVGGGSFGRRYGPVVAIGVALVAMATVAAVGNRQRAGGEAVEAVEGVTVAGEAGTGTGAGAGGGGGGGGGGAAAQGAVSWSDAAAAGTTGEIEWGERCDTSRGVLAYPGRHPAECFAPFGEGRDNGGATAPGVSADEVTVVLYQPQEHDPILEYITGAVGSDDSNAEVARTLRGWQAFYETYFETYGRTVRLVPYTATGAANDDVAARADATQIAERHHPFAVIGGPILSPAFGDALVSRRIVCIDCMPDQRDAEMARRAPYVISWHIQPDQADRHVAEFVGRQLEGRDAIHAGDADLRQRRRSFGIVYLSDGRGDDDLAPLEAALADEGVSLDEAVAYTSPVDLQRDAPSVIARLRSAGVTSVLFAGDPLAPAALTTAASDQDWWPEWIVVGAGYTDSTLFARTYDQRQWAHAFGVTFLPARVDPAADGATDLYRWFHGHAPPAASAGLVALDLELLYGALQGAGPGLTPAGFQQALFAAPPTPAGDPTYPVLSWGDHGFWPSTDHGGIDDATAIWWDPSAWGPDEAGEQGEGMYTYVDGGRRYLPGEWPSEPLPLFEPDGAIALYERPPAAAATAASAAPAPARPD